MNGYLIAKLKEGRLNRGLKQSDVTKFTGIKNTTLSNYENGITEPDIDTFLQLCGLYGIDYAEILGEAYGLNVQGSDFDIKPSEIDRIKKYRSLDDIGRQHVDTVLTWEAERVFYQNLHLENEKRDDEIPVYILNYYQRLASAGSGEYLFDSIPTDTIEVPITPISEQADFAIDVNGRSMEPTYYDGDKVYVKITDEIPIGRIGVFTRGNECFIKELGINCLKSHNHANGYEDIPASDDIKLVGEILGKVED